MFALRQGGEYLVTVTNLKPNETVYYSAGKYIVKPGDTLFSIAKKYRMSLAELLSKNSQILNKNMILPGQRINVN